jgi:glycosyltransferase involved in cell wall biosynthesis
MKIAYLVADFPKHSETFVAREVIKLRELGCPIEVFAFGRPLGPDIQKLDAGAITLMNDVHYVPRGGKILLEHLRHGKLLRHMNRTWGIVRESKELSRAATLERSPMGLAQRALELADVMAARGIEHIHAHWPYPSQVAHLISRLTGIPYSVSIHAHEVEHENGHFRDIFKTLSFAVFCNRAAMNHLLTLLPAGYEARCHLVYHGVDLSRFEQLPFPTSTSPLRVLSAGRFETTKGFDRLIRGCAAARSEGVSIELTILGEGPQRDELLSLAASLGFSDALEMPGWVPHDQVRRYMESAHLFALTADTDYHDGLPNVALEALACGRPAVLSPLPAAPEFVAHGREAFILSAPDNLEGLRTFLRSAARAPGQLLEMGRAARERVERDFDADVHARRLKRLFENGHRQQPNR